MSHGPSTLFSLISAILKEQLDTQKSMHASRSDWLRAITYVVWRSVIGYCPNKRPILLRSQFVLFGRVSKRSLILVVGCSRGEDAALNRGVFG